MDVRLSGLTMSLKAICGRPEKFQVLVGVFGAGGWCGGGSACGGRRGGVAEVGGGV